MWASTDVARGQSVKTTEMVTIPTTLTETEGHQSSTSMSSEGSTVRDTSETSATNLSMTTNVLEEGTVTEASVIITKETGKATTNVIKSLVAATRTTDQLGTSSSDRIDKTSGGLTPTVEETTTNATTETSKDDTSPFTNAVLSSIINLGQSDLTTRKLTTEYVATSLGEISTIGTETTVVSTPEAQTSDTTSTAKSSTPREASLTTQTQKIGSVQSTTPTIKADVKDIDMGRLEAAQRDIFTKYIEITTPSTTSKPEVTATDGMMISTGNAIQGETQTSRSSTTVRTQESTMFSTTVKLTETSTTQIMAATTLPQITQSTTVSIDDATKTTPLMSVRSTTISSTEKGLDIYVPTISSSTTGIAEKSSPSLKDDSTSSEYIKKTTITDVENTTFMTTHASSTTIKSGEDTMFSTVSMDVTTRETTTEALCISAEGTGKAESSTLFILPTGKTVITPSKISTITASNAVIEGQTISTGTTVLSIGKDEGSTTTVITERNIDYTSKAITGTSQEKPGSTVFIDSNFPGTFKDKTTTPTSEKVEGLTTSSTDLEASTIVLSTNTAKEMKTSIESSSEASKTSTKVISLTTSTGPTYQTSDIVTTTLLTTTENPSSSTVVNIATSPGRTDEPTGSTRAGKRVISSSTTSTRYLTSVTSEEAIEVTTQLSTGSVPVTATDSVITATTIGINTEGSKTYSNPTTFSATSESQPPSSEGTTLPTAGSAILTAGDSTTKATSVATTLFSTTGTTPDTTSISVEITTLPITGTPKAILTDSVISTTKAMESDGAGTTSKNATLFSTTGITPEMSSISIVSTLPSSGFPTASDSSTSTRQTTWTNLAGTTSINPAPDLIGSTVESPSISIEVTTLPTKGSPIATVTDSAISTTKAMGTDGGGSTSIDATLFSTTRATAESQSMSIEVTTLPTTGSPIAIVTDSVFTTKAIGTNDVRTTTFTDATLFSTPGTTSESSSISIAVTTHPSSDSPIATVTDPVISTTKTIETDDGRTSTFIDGTRFSTPGTTSESQSISIEMTTLPTTGSPIATITDSMVSKIKTTELIGTMTYLAHATVSTIGTTTESPPTINEVTSLPTAGSPIATATDLVMSTTKAMGTDGVTITSMNATLLSTPGIASEIPLISVEVTTLPTTSSSIATVTEPIISTTKVMGTDGGGVTTSIDGTLFSTMEATAESPLISIEVTTLSMTGASTAAVTDSVTSTIKATGTDLVGTATSIYPGAVSTIGTTTESRPTSVEVTSLPTAGSPIAAVTDSAISTLQTTGTTTSIDHAIVSTIGITESPPTSIEVATLLTTSSPIATVTNSEVSTTKAIGTDDERTATSIDGTLFSTTGTISETSSISIGVTKLPTSSSSIATASDSVASKIKTTEIDLIGTVTSTDSATISTVGTTKKSPPTSNEVTNRATAGSPIAKATDPVISIAKTMVTDGVTTTSIGATTFSTTGATEESPFISIEVTPPINGATTAAVTDSVTSKIKATGTYSVGTATSINPETGSTVGTTPENPPTSIEVTSLPTTGSPIATVTDSGMSTTKAMGTDGGRSISIDATLSSTTGTTVEKTSISTEVATFPLTSSLIATITDSATSTLQSTGTELIRTTISIGPATVSTTGMSGSPATSIEVATTSSPIPTVTNSVVSTTKVIVTDDGRTAAPIDATLSSTPGTTTETSPISIEVTTLPTTSHSIATVTDSTISTIKTTGIDLRGIMTSIGPATISAIGTSTESPPTSIEVTILPTISSPTVSDSILSTTKAMGTDGVGSTTSIDATLFSTAGTIAESPSTSIEVTTPPITGSSTAAITDSVSSTVKATGTDFVGTATSTDPETVSTIETTPESPPTSVEVTSLPMAGSPIATVTDSVISTAKTMLTDGGQITSLEPTLFSATETTAEKTSISTEITSLPITSSPIVTVTDSVIPTTKVIGTDGEITKTSIDFTLLSTTETTPESLPASTKATTLLTAGSSIGTLSDSVTFATKATITSIESTVSKGSTMFSKIITTDKSPTLTSAGSPITSETATIQFTNTATLLSTQLSNDTNFSKATTISPISSSVVATTIKALAVKTSGIPTETIIGTTTSKELPIISTGGTALLKASSLSTIVDGASVVDTLRTVTTGAMLKPSTKSSIVTDVNLSLGTTISNKLSTQHQEGASTTDIKPALSQPMNSSTVITTQINKLEGTSPGHSLDISVHPSPSTKAASKTTTTVTNKTLTAETTTTLFGKTTLIEKVQGLESSQVSKKMETSQGDKPPTTATTSGRAVNMTIRTNATTPSMQITKSSQVTPMTNKTNNVTPSETGPGVVTSNEVTISLNRTTSYGKLNVTTTMTPVNKTSNATHLAETSDDGLTTSDLILTGLGVVTGTVLSSVLGFGALYLKKKDKRKHMYVVNEP